MSDSPKPIILFEVDTRGLQPASRQAKLLEVSEAALNLATDTVKDMAYRLTKKIRELETDVTPDEAEIEFAVKLELEGGTLASFITKVSGGGQLNVKFKWRIDRPANPTVLVSPGAG